MTINNGQMAVWNNAENGCDTKQLREDSESEGLNIYPLNVKSDRTEGYEPRICQGVGKESEPPRPACRSQQSGRLTSGQAGLDGSEGSQDGGISEDKLGHRRARTDVAAEEIGSTRESSDAEENTASETDPPRPAPIWSRGFDILEPLRQIGLFNRMSKKAQGAVGVIYCLARTKEVDLDDIANQVARAVPLPGFEEEWLQNVVNCGLVIALGPKGGVNELAKKLNLEAEVVESLASFMGMYLCKPLGPGLSHWIQRNLWRKPPAVLLELTGAELGDLMYLLDGETPPRRRDVKEVDEEIIEFFDSTVLRLRNLRDELKSKLFKKEAVAVYLLCTNKVTTVINEIRQTISRKLEHDAELARNGNGGITMDKELLEQFRPVVEKVAGTSAKRIPTITAEELENDLWIGAIIGFGTWDPGRSSLGTWVKNNIMWRLRQVQRYEYTRLKYEKPYPDEGGDPPVNSGTHDGGSNAIGD